MLILFSALQAVDYDPHSGFRQHAGEWVMAGLDGLS
jgi:CHASE1-domain containing sensor protein